MFCTLKQKVIFLVLSGLFVATMGLILYLTFPSLLDNEIKKRLILKEGSQTYKYWKEAPVPIYIRFYFFNVTNPEEVYELKKPVLEELGPYTFREEREKVNITWNENGTVSYRQIKRWFFQPDKTVGSLNDLITTLNVPMVAAAARAKTMDQPMVYFSLEEIFSAYGCPWLVNKTVQEFLFDGYDDILLKYAKLVVDIPYDKFGWFYKRNNTDDGEFDVYTGEDDIEIVDEVHTWNNRESVTSYEPPCNMINGSAGDIWPPGLTDKDKPTMFVPDLCRSMSFTYLQNVKIHGINTLRYWADRTELDNGKYNPENTCFCSSNDTCLPAGGVDVSTCKFDAPAVVSYPHFLFADSAYSQGVIGMKPNPQEHRMYLDLLPEMGIPLGVAARMQINIVFERVENITTYDTLAHCTLGHFFEWAINVFMFLPSVSGELEYQRCDAPRFYWFVDSIGAKILLVLVRFYWFVETDQRNFTHVQFNNITRRTYFPMFWFSETAEAGTDITDELKLVLVTLPLVFNTISFILVTIGSFLVLTAFVLAILYALEKKDPEYATVSSGSSRE